MTDVDSMVDRVAEAIRTHAYCSPISRSHPWAAVKRPAGCWGCDWEADPDSKMNGLDQWAAHAAQAATDALQLRPEAGRLPWSRATGHVCPCGDTPWWDMDSIVDEFHPCERGEHGDETFPATRLVSPWVVADGGTQP